MAYYGGLLARHAALPRVHRDGTEVLITTEVALYDILTLFRLKLNYGRSYEQASRFFVPGARHATQLDRLFAFPDFGDMVRFLPRDLLPGGDASGIATIADLERALWQRFLQLANRAFYTTTGNLASAIAFYTIKRVELANLIQVIEGVRYGLAPGFLRQGLIRPR